MDNLLILGKNAIKAFMNQKRKRHDEYQKKKIKIKLKRMEEDLEREKEDLEREKEREKEDLDLEEEWRIMNFEDEFGEEILKKNKGGLFRALNEKCEKIEKKNNKK